MQLNTDFRDLISAFNAETVDYVVIGAFAMAMYGLPRFTGDMDILYRADKDNALRILKALEAFGYRPAELTVEALLEPDSVFYFGRPPVRVDLLNDISGISFEDVWKSKVPMTVQDVSFHLISVDDLVTNKLATGRAKDLLDVELIKSLKTSD